MFRFTVKIYTYNDGQSATFDVGGYNYSASPYWVNCFAIQSGEALPRYNVRFGYDGSSDCVWIGEVGSVWSYPQVFVTDFQAGYNSVGVSWATGWSVSFVTSFDTVVQSRNVLALNTYNAASYVVTSVAGYFGAVNLAGSDIITAASNAAQDIGVSKLMRWKNYGNNHVIFDASASTSPSGSSINNTNPGSAWAATYPTLMGWNGSSTYGVRVYVANWSDACSGNAATITGQANSATITAATAATANTIALRDSNADLFSRYNFSSYVNTTDAVIGSGMTYIIGKFGNDYHQSASAATVRTFLSVGTSNQNLNTTDSPTFAEHYANGWFRSNTSGTGWYHQVHGSGIYANANGQVRTYNGSSFYSEGTISGASSITASTFIRATTYLYTDQNYGYGLVGAYLATAYRLIYAMGGAYVIATDGSSVAGAYALIFAYDQTSGGKNITGLNYGHGIGLVTNGVHRVYLGESGSYFTAPVYISSSATVVSTLGVTGNITGSAEIYKKFSGTDYRVPTIEFGTSSSPPAAARPVGSIYVQTT
jgi:hypothetical protein